MIPGVTPGPDEAALERVQQISTALGELADRVDQLAHELETAVNELRAAPAPSEPAALVEVPPAPEPEPVPVHEPERRSGSDRRSGLDRRRVAPEGLAARVFGAIERRSRVERRSGTGRRSGDFLAPEE